MNESPLILVIDDEIEILKALKESLEDENYRVETLHEGDNALQLIGKLIPDIILLDIFMPNCNGLKLLESIKKEYPQQKIIIISGFGNIPIAIEAVKKGALDFIEKPLNLDKIISKIEFLKKENNEDQDKPSSYKENINEKTRKELGIIGESFLFIELLQQIEKVSNIPIPVMIYGQHGTGKNIIAKYLHKISTSSNKDFFEIDCSTLDDKQLLEKIEKAFNSNAGCIHIKNIHEMKCDAQKKLLYYANNTTIRIIASSPIALFDLFKKNIFNSSLYFKLNLVPIEIPPLNKRRYDIPLLIDFFLEKANRKNKKHIIFNNKTIRKLRNHNWQGNIEELKQVIHKIVVSSLDPYKVVSPNEINKFLNEKDIQLIEEQSFTRFNSLKDATKEFEKKFLLYLLKKNRYDINQVCDQLNLTPPQLKNKMLELNI